MDKDEEDEVQLQSLKSFFNEHCTKFFVENLPMESIKELPGIYMYTLGSFAHGATLAILGYFIYINYQYAVTKPYISILSGDGCDTVSIAVTGGYIADQNGYWQGSPQYVYSESVYKLSLNSFQADSVVPYKAMMKTFYDSYILEGQLAKTQTLTENLLVWVNSIEYYSLGQPGLTNFSSVGFGQLQSFQLEGNPSNVFNQIGGANMFSSQAGVCNIFNLCYYDMANSEWVAEYSNYTLFTTAPECEAAVKTLSLGSRFKSNANEAFRVVFDTSSFMTAIAVNMQKLMKYELKQVGQETSLITVLQDEVPGGYTFIFRFYFDTRWVGMAPVLCAENLTALPPELASLQFLCFYESYGVISLPVFNPHGGYSQENTFAVNGDIPDYCDCSTSRGHSKDCNNFNFLSGLVYYNGATAALNFESTVRLMAKYHSYQAFNRAAYNASFASTSAYYASDMGTSPEVQERFSRYFDFCTLDNSTSCALNSWHTFDPLTHVISDLNYELYNGSCSDAFLVSPEAFTRILDTAPVKLTQDYFECYVGWSDALLDAVGVASGNAAMLVPILVLGVLPIFYGILWLLSILPEKAEYKDADKKAITEFIALTLLRIRDGKTRGIKPDGHLISLTQELIKVAKSVGGYPDSDDEESDSDDEVSDDDDEKAGDSRSKGGSAASERNRTIVSALGLGSSGLGSKKQSLTKKSNVTVTQQATKRHSTRNKASLSAERMLGLQRTKSGNSYEMESKTPATGLRSARKSISDKLKGLLGGTPQQAGGGAEEVQLTQMQRSINRQISELPQCDASTGSTEDYWVLNNTDMQQGEKILRFQQKVKGKMLSILLRDLGDLFSECMSLGEQQGEEVQSPLQVIVGGGHDRDRDSDDEEAHGQGASSNSSSACSSKKLDLIRGSQQYLEARRLAAKLSLVDVQALVLRADLLEVFLNIYNIVQLHAAIEMQVEVSLVPTRMQKEVAYNVGGRIISYSKFKEHISFLQG